MSQIHKIDMAKILCGDGYVTILVEDCHDGIVNIDIVEVNLHQVRLGIPVEGGKHYLFWDDVKTQCGKP